MVFSAIFQATQTRKFKISSMHFCIVFVVLFSFIFIQLSQHYELYRMVLSFCYQIELYLLGNALFIRLSRNFQLFKLVSQEIDFCNFNSVFATFHCCIRHISRHNFDWHKNCTQNVLIYQSNYLFRNTDIISANMANITMKSSENAIEITEINLL